MAYEQVGADWLDGQKLAAVLNSRSLPGVRAYPTRFRPTAYHFAGQTVDGVRFVITDRDTFDSVRLGLTIIYSLQQLYPGRIDIAINRRLIGNKAVVSALEAGKDPATIEQNYKANLQDFLRRRIGYLLYGN